MNQIFKFILQDNQSQTNHRQTNPIPKIRETPKKPYLSKKKKLNNFIEI
jgi:hypothetical protein